VNRRLNDLKFLKNRGESFVVEDVEEVETAIDLEEFIGTIESYLRSE
jgi:hypothetical protein